MKAVAAAGQQLMGVSLMPHIPDQLILRQAEYTVQGKCQLHRTQAGRQVTAILRNDLYQEFADFLCQFLQIKQIETLQI